MRRFAESIAAVLLTLFLPADLHAEKEERKGPPPLDVPLPVGQEARTFRFPFYDSNGNLQMRFQISVAKRLDETFMQMTEATIETFHQDGTRDLMIQLPASLLNLKTRVVSSDGRVTIERSDFKLTGKGMEFDTRKRAGKLTGDIRMLLYDRDSNLE